MIEHMRANLCSEIGLPELTAQSGLSRAHFFRAFKHSTGMTPYRYLTDLRLEAARRLLDARELAAIDVGPAVGMRSRAKFSALFCRRFGLTPRAYRASLS